MKNKNLWFNNEINIASFLYKITQNFSASDFNKLNYKFEDWINWLNSDEKNDDLVDFDLFKLWFKRRELIGNRPDLNELFFNYNNFCNNNADNFVFNINKIKLFLYHQNSEEFYYAKMLFRKIEEYDYFINNKKLNKTFIEKKLNDTISVLNQCIELYSVLFYINFDKKIMRKILENIDNIQKFLSDRIELLKIAKSCKE